MKNKIVSFLKRTKIVPVLYTGALYILFFIFGKIFSVKKNAIVFESFLGKQYSDNPRAIYEYVKRKYPDAKLYWSIDLKYYKNFKDENLEILKRRSLKWVYHMATSKYWVSNSRLPLWIPKPRHTIYLQTWHGTPLKRLGVDIDTVHMPGTNTEEYKKNFVFEAQKWDYLISPNMYSTKIFRRAFAFNKEVIESGYPRNDDLINLNNEEHIKNIKKSNQIPGDKKIILYAPTWRDNQFYEIGKYKFELELDLDLLQKSLGDEYIVLLRLHYLVSTHLNIEKYKGFVYDYSAYPDLRELYLIADLLITDYSSVFFDYAILNRPMLFFVYDIEEYHDRLRGFYFDFEEESPGPLVKTTVELINEIKQAGTHLEDGKKLQSFREKYTALEDGKATKRVAERVFKNL